ncbi:phosphoribosylformylglycinamidine cyclo ligase [Legionella birminghamensis]|uniref:Phosphoribosylformylglycinamidine cyclo-ligase n=1 Tax=Legionella birminghamensis TaxID=28083 RepID=A0A378I7Q5_9GAMM|nr:phosphoribosylformylglycinamidine cyclo-ligase [Legionella birminghamensis]KTC68023.1 phosphoribosylformylglycinamidine cyclo ligase [Legionella birminghamensis]STX31268.1 phosphoribosylformylglycinamidine cyclo ligase [Legionella birminghamensis]
MTSIDYKTAGVDVEAGNQAVRRIKSAVESTFSKQVLTGIGNFASMYDLKFLTENYQHPVLVQSIDGVGTKMMVARMMQKFDTIGIDLVSATANDIIVLGAKPLTLLDYIANDKLNPLIIEEIIKGMVTACRENGISLVGGEMAEMPGTYCPGELDLAGIITGVVEKDKAILGHSICEGDIIACFPSSGLHTNGYTLARKLFFDVSGYRVDSHFQDFDHSLGEELLTPHINYTQPIMHLLDNNIPIKGMAHITGGGLLENIPRVLPAGCAAEIDKNKIPRLPLFSLIRHLSRLEDQELYRTFNMGAGMVLIFAPETQAAIVEALKAFPDFPLYEIGQITKGNREVTLL